MDNPDGIQGAGVLPGNLKHVAHMRANCAEVLGHMSKAILIPRPMFIMHAIVVVNKAEFVLHTVLGNAINPLMRIFMICLQGRKKTNEITLSFGNMHTALMSARLPNIIRTQDFLKCFYCHGSFGFNSSVFCKSCASLELTGINSFPSSFFHRDRSIMTRSTVSS